MADTSGPSPWIVDVLQLNLDDLDVKQLPALSCSAINAAHLQGSLTISGIGSGNSLTVTGDASVTGAMAVTKDLTVNGTLHINDIVSSVGVVIVHDPLYVEKSIMSDGWRVTTLELSGGASGPLPKTTTFFSHKDTTLLILASGSGFSGSDGGTIGMDVQIDGKSYGQLQSYSNEKNSHKAFVGNPLVVTTLVGQGDRILTLTALTGTSTDKNDYFSVTILELPFIHTPEINRRRR